MKTSAGLAVILFVGINLFRLCETTHDAHVNGRMRGRKFEHNHDLTHPLTGEVIKLKSKGKFRNVVNLDKVQGLKNIRCFAQKLWLKFENSKDIKTTKAWRVGEVITGNCLSSEGGTIKTIKKLKEMGKKHLEVVFAKASPYQVLEYADIFHHHKPPDENHLTNCTEEHRRLKRETWFQDFEKWTKNKIVGTILPIDWNKKFGIERHFNYDTKRNRAMGNFAVDISRSGRITFDSMDNKYFEQDTTGIEDQSWPWYSGPSSTLKVECEHCYMSFTAGVTFVLKIRSDENGNVVFEKFLLEFGTEAKLNYDVKVNGKYGTHRHDTTCAKRLWKSSSPKVFPIAIPFAFGIHLKLNLNLELWFESSFNVDTDLSASFGFDSVAKRTIKIEKVTDNPTDISTTHIYRPFNAHPVVVDCQSCNPTGKLSFYPQVEIGAGLALDISALGYTAFEIALVAPVDIWLKPDFGIKKTRKESLGRYYADFTLDAGYKTQPMEITLDAFGRHWEWNLLSVNRRGEITLEHKIIPEDTDLKANTEDTHGGF